MTKKKLLIILLLFSVNFISSQENEIEILRKISNKLVAKKKQINDSLKKIEERINYLNSKKDSPVTENLPFIETTTRLNAKVRNKAGSFGDVIGNIAKGKTIKVYGFFDNYWLIEKDSLRGYASELYLYENFKMKLLKKKYSKNEIKKKFGENIANKIFNHRIWIGMTTEMATLSVGSPIKINKSTGSWGIHEQWVYKGKYLYFEDGKLTSWQD